jgi:hypothetical protein
MPEVVVIAGAVAGPCAFVNSPLSLKRGSEFLGDYFFQAIASKTDGKRLPIPMQERP